MINVNGMNLSLILPDEVEKNTSIQINGYWISILKDDRWTRVREPAQASWMDEKHRKVVDAFQKLEHALAELMQAELVRP